MENVGALGKSLTKNGGKWDDASIAQAVALAKTADDVIVVISNAEVRRLLCWDPPYAPRL